MIKRQGAPQIKPKDRLTVKSVSGPDPITKISEIKIEIMYILDYPQGDGIYLGCRFIKLSRDLGKLIDTFVHRKLKELNSDTFQIY